MYRADLMVVPVQPRAVDSWALADIAALIDRAQEAPEEQGRAPLRVLLADPGGNRDTIETIAALAGWPPFTVAPRSAGAARPLRMPWRMAARGGGAAP